MQEKKENRKFQPLAPKWKLITVEAILVIVTLFYLANGEDLLDEYYIPGAIIFYLLLTISGPIYFSTPKNRPPVDTIKRGLLFGVPAFFLTFIICLKFLPKPELIGPPTTGAIIFIGFIAAFNEEVIFRKYMPLRFGIFASAIFFGIFHYAVLGADVGGMFYMFGFALLLSGAYNLGGLGASGGVHSGYNLTRIGVGYI